MTDVPRWVSGEKYEKCYQHALHLSHVRADLVEAILNIDANAVALGGTEDGFVAVGYFVPISPIHKALGVIGHGAPKNPDVMPPEWFAGLIKRAVERTGAALHADKEREKE